MGKARKGEHQKLKMLYLMQIFMQDTDDSHGLTVAEIITKLSAKGVNADRKTLYRDFEELREFGLDIIKDKQGRNFYYHLGERDFELPELKLLVDSVQAAKFITDKKSQRLIKKLESLVSKYEGKKLQRQVVIAGRVKTINETIYYNVDKIHEAIGTNEQIKFHYFQWNIQKEMELRHGGEYYYVSPWALVWDDENYYLVAYDDIDQKIKHFRVDKMLDVVTTGQARSGRKAFNQFDMAQYTKSLFGMFGGETTTVGLVARNEFAGIIIDRFGKDIVITPVDEDHFKTTVKVVISNQFLGWIMALGDGVKIVSPKKVVARMQTEVMRLATQYKC